MNQKKGILIFAGTTEGKQLAEYLNGCDIEAYVSTATEYGRQCIQETGNIIIIRERMDLEQLIEFIRSKCSMVIDTTHPYAVEIKKKIKTACTATKTRYLRISRAEGANPLDDVVFVPDIASAVNYLKNTEGNVLVTTGSKEISEFAKLDDYKERIFARVLSLPSSVEACSRIGLVGEHLMCMQGPFSLEMNISMMKHVNAKFLVTKDSGEPGGFGEKISAAAEMGTKVIVIGRPEEEMGLTMDEALSEIATAYNINIPQKKRTITLVGMGMGDPDGMTMTARRSIDEADLLVGAKRMLEILPTHGKDVFPEYDCKKVLSFLHEHKEYKKIAVLLSGDVGFHSGAKQFRENIDPSEYDLDSVCGISSVVYFCSRINVPWDDVFLMSAHSDDDANIIGEVRHHRKVFTLVRGKEGLQKLCNDLLFYEIDVQIIAAQDLGSSNERIVYGNPVEVLNAGLSGLCVALIVNERPMTSIPLNIHDEDFIRGPAPMTKAEIRTLSIAKLELSDDSVIYDVGAGTGSVSIEMALMAVNGEVFAIEKEKETISLINQNKKKFCTPNLTIVEGLAPDALADLPIPTHAFIGGSSGNMEEILVALFNKNPKARIVVNSVTLETVSETLLCIKKLGLDEEETICINSSRSRSTGNYHLMTANNPIYITVIRGKI